MLLEPGGFIQPHRDFDERRMAAFNVALSNPDGVQFAQEDAGDSSQVNVFFPAPEAPTYPNYFNRNVASGAVNATVAENNVPTSLRVAIPNANIQFGLPGGNYLDDGWSGSNSSSSVGYAAKLGAWGSLYDVIC